jgi:class 3 adenylate cyclase
VCRERGEVVGEQVVLEPACRRGADLVAANGRVELLKITRLAIEAHPQRERIVQNVGRIIFRKLNTATDQRLQLQEKLRDAEELLRTYVGTYAISEGKLAERSLLEGHRRQRAVVWFSDVAGFSKYASTMSPDRVAALVQDFLTPQVVAIEKAGGFIDKFIGDAVMAYWIVVSSDGAAECASALQAAEQARAEVGLISVGNERLALRIGLHVGEVHTGDFGTVDRRQYTLIGDAVNRAARLEQAKESDLGPLRVSSDLFELLTAELQVLVPDRREIDAKNLGRLVVFTNANGRVKL